MVLLQILCCSIFYVLQSLIRSTQTNVNTRTHKKIALVLRTLLDLSLFIALPFKIASLQNRFPLELLPFKTASLFLCSTNGMISLSLFPPSILHALALLKADCMKLAGQRQREKSRPTFLAIFSSNPSGLVVSIISC